VILGAYKRRNALGVERVWFEHLSRKVLSVWAEKFRTKFLLKLILLKFKFC